MNPPPVHNTWAVPGLAAVFVIILAAVVFALMRWARGSIRTADDFLVAGRRIGVGQNAFAMLGGFIMYSTIIVMIGHIALNGYDAIIMLTAFTIGSVLGVLIYAAPMRNVGGHTLGDLFVLRARERPARIASAVVTLTIYGLFMIAMLAAIGLVTARMFSTDSKVNIPFVAGMVAVSALVMIVWVFMGGMVGVTRLLVLKSVLMVITVVALTVAVLARYKMNIFHLLDDAQAHAKPNPHGYDWISPGRQFGKGSTYDSNQDPWVHFSKLFCLAFGGMGMPWVFMRYYVATSGREARRSAGWATMMMTAFYSFVAVLGVGAIAILGGKNIGGKVLDRDITFPKLVDNLGGKWTVGAVSAVAMVSVAAIFGALLINAVTSFTKDINAARGVRSDPATELKDVRRNVLVIGIVSLVLGTVMVPLMSHILIPTSIDLGGAMVLAPVVYSLYWRRFNTAGLKWTIYGGLTVTLLMVLFSNGVSGDPGNAMFPHLNFKLFDFEPGLVSIPVAFLLGYIGTITSSERNDAGFAEMQVRSLTGAVVPPRKDSLTGRAAERDPESQLPSEAH